MAARKTNWTPEIVRQRIKTGVLTKRLEDHALGVLELSQTQIRAAEILLRKTVPDLLGVAHSGSVELTKPEELSDVALANIATGSSNRVIEAQDGQEEPSELH